MFFYSEGGRNVKNKYPYIELYEKRKPEYIEEIVSALSLDEFNPFDFSCVENNIKKPLRLSGYSQEYLDSLDLQTLFDKAFILKEQELIKAAHEWINRVLSDIDSKSKRLTGGAEGEKEESSIIIDRKRLEKEAFSETLEDFMRRKGINYVFEYSLTKPEPPSNPLNNSNGLIAVLERSGIKND